MDELDTKLMVDDLSRAIASLALGSILLFPLYEVLCQSWQEGVVPQDMTDAKIITLYKNKGERSDCNNYRDISLLSIVGETLLAERANMSSQSNNAAYEMKGQW